VRKKFLVFKQSSLKKDQSKITPKKFYEIDSRMEVTNTLAYYGNELIKAVEKLLILTATSYFSKLDHSNVINYFSTSLEWSNLKCNACV
jgi:hypothetical protein